MTGIQISSICLSAFKENPVGFEFVSVDVSDMIVRVKHMSIVTYALARVLCEEARDKPSFTANRYSNVKL